MREIEWTFEAMLGVPFSGGNSVRVLLNGEQIFPAMLSAIESAKHSVQFLTFVYWTGDIAKRFAATLADKARHGVRVSVLLDDVGSFEMPRELVDEMVTAGVHVRRFRPLKKLRLHRINHRTHRKVLVCDGEVGFSGGVGIAKQWEGAGDCPENWRDTHFELRGPVVRGLQGAFYDNWFETGEADELPEILIAEPDCQGEARIQVLRSHGLSKRSDVMTATLLLIRAARERVRIQTAYFVPDSTMRDELCATARRGVRVEVMLPGAHTDQRLCNLAGRTEFEDLLQAGVRLYTFERTMLHTKVATVDGQLAFVGSPNFNHRSTRRDDEIALTILDESLVGELDEHFDKDLESCREIDADSWPDRGLPARFREYLASFLKSRL